MKYPKFSYHLTCPVPKLQNFEGLYIIRNLKWVWYLVPAKISVLGHVRAKISLLVNSFVIG